MYILCDDLDIKTILRYTNLWIFSHIYGNLLKVIWIEKENCSQTNR